MNNNSPARFAALFLVAVLSVLSCQSGDTTSPAHASTGDPVGPTDFQPSVALVFAPGPTMTVGVTGSIALTAVNVLPQSCVVSGPAWLTLLPGSNADSAWSVTASQAGIAPLVTACKDVNHHFVTAFDTVEVFAMPSVTLNMAGSVPVGIGDSVDVTYDSTDTHTIDVSCVNCSSVGALARVGPNAIRFYAQHIATDALHRSICFTVHGGDGHYTRQECLGVVVRGGQVAPHSVTEAVRLAEVVPLHSVPVATYDNTGQSTHPDFIRVAAGWSGGACWLAYTPYAGSNGNVENPSLARSPDCEHWTPAPGVRAPLFDRPSDGYNSDPELIYDSLDGCLGVVFRQVTSANNIVLSKSCDGTTWPAPRLLFAAPNHRAVSPTIAAGPDGRNRVWYVDAGSLGCSSLTNVVRMRMANPTLSTSLDSVQFGSEVATDLVQPGYVIWHIKIRYIPEKNMYLAMYAAFPLPETGPGNCATNDLFVATSTDGLHWTSFPVPIINKLDRRFNFTTLYRASFTYNPATDNLRTITSALEDTWGQYGVVYNFTALMTALNTSTTVAASQLVPSFNLVRKADPHRKVVKIEDQP